MPLYRCGIRTGPPTAPPNTLRLKSGMAVPGAIRKPVIRVQRRVAVKLVDIAVQIVRPALGDHVDDRAAGVAEFSAEVIRLDLELLYRVNGRLVFQISDAAVLLDVGDADAVEQYIGGRVARAVRREIRVALSARIQVRRRYSRR